MADDKKEEFLTELLRSSESVLEKDYPNPGRVGCPGNAALQQLADFSEDHPPVELDVVRHVAECYPCFFELREMRRKRQASN